MIILAAIAAIGLISLGVFVGLSAATTNKTAERPVILVRERVVIVMPCVDRRV